MTLELSERGSLTWQVTPDLLGFLDSSAQFTDTNPAWFTTLGYRAEEVESKTYDYFLHPDDKDTSILAFADVQRGKPVLNFENRYRHADGSYRWLAWNSVPVGGRIFCMARDITQQKETEAALKTSAEEAVLREQFIAVLSHDLRNPLAALNSGMNILRRKYGADADRDLLEAMGGSIKRMTGLIDDVMDLARARLGTGISMTMKTAVVLTPTLQQTVQEIRAGQPTAQIVEDYRFDQPVLCEANRIAQLLSNLLSNAISHGDISQPVRVRAYDQNGNFILSVENNGPRISDQARPLLFQPFARGDVRDSQNGLGLGLFIASEIAKGHGGTLTFTSDDDVTVFTLTIPK
ncbi:PAS domain-containing sensor histidine kinase [Oceaniglobus ichthyenteri]|uniref:PAS domain-containing sensor histidine kinase n=1 Tax=Oceaniglobus ichthyenteri TaxID=2136177 RepID=UPI000D3568AA|nr:PAS domain-containing sensor histidine kinase [Oceaniglobus ichthyenteri]